MPNNRVIQFRRDGRYRIEGTLFLRNRHHLTIDGEGSLVFATTRAGRNRAQWWITDGSQIVFRNLAVKGANPHGGVGEDAYVPKLANQAGFHFEGVDGAELDHVRVTDVYGDFAYLGRDKHKVPSRNVWIHDSTFLRNGRQGIAVTAATNVIVEDNHFDDTRRSTIDLEPNAHSWHVTNVFVLNNTVGKGRLLFVASHGQGPVNNVVISGNRLLGHPLTIDVLPPGKKRRSNWVVTNNVSNTIVRSRPMRFAGIDGLVVSGNTQRVTGRQPGVVIAGDCGAHVSGNQFGSGVVSQHGRALRGGPGDAESAAASGTRLEHHDRPARHRTPSLDHDGAGHDAGDVAGSRPTRLRRRGEPVVGGVRRGVRAGRDRAAPAGAPAAPRRLGNLSVARFRTRCSPPMRPPTPRSPARSGAGSAR